MISASPLASSVAEKLRGLDGPWDVYAERSRRFEIQLLGAKVELVRGPLRLDGYGVRVLKRVDGQTGVGFQASMNFTPEGIHAAVESAEAVSKFTRFPAPHPELPAGKGGPAAVPKLVDPGLWSDPSGLLEQEAMHLLAAFDAERLAPPTFATLRATLLESSVANSEGVAVAYAHTVVEREIAVKADGGPEGPPAGEFWVNDSACRFEPDGSGERVREWYRYAEDARRAGPPPVGERSVVLPADVLAEVLPPIIGFQFSATAQLRGLGFARGAMAGVDRLDLSDDGLHDWAVGSSPIDDEGTPQRVRELVVKGKATEVMTDALYANALGTATTGNSVRGMRTGPAANYWWKFTRAPAPDLSTLSLAPGDGGSDEELMEGVGDGVWVEQLGFAQPDLVSGTFGAEIRLGYRIRGGKLAEPLRGGTVGGPVVAQEGRPSMLSGIEAIGSGARLVGHFLGPTLVVRNLTVSGEP